MNIFTVAMAAVEVAANAPPVTIELDWRTIALAACGLVVALCSWIWVSTMSWMKRISENFDKHVAEDNKAFADVKEIMNDNHIDLINTINRKRKDD